MLNSRSRLATRSIKQLGRCGDTHRRLLPSPGYPQFTRQKNPSRRPNSTVNKRVPSRHSSSQALSARPSDGLAPGLPRYPKQRSTKLRGGIHPGSMPASSALVGSGSITVKRLTLLPLMPVTSCVETAGSWTGDGGGYGCTSPSSAQVFACQRSGPSIDQT